MPDENCAALGNLLIVAEDLVDVAPPDTFVDDPDDVDAEDEGILPAEIEFDFTALGSVTIVSITVLDVEPEEAVATATLTNGAVVVFDLGTSGDNGKAVVSLGPTADVKKVVVTLQGSGAIDDLEFCPPAD